MSSIYHFIVTNWKTSLCGLCGGIVALSLASGWISTDTAAFFGTLIAAVTGFVSKDGNVTGDGK